MRAVLRRMRSCKATEWQGEDQSIIRIQHRRAGGTGKPVLLHLVRYTPGQGAATLNPDPEGREDDGGAQQPPKGREFKAGECFVLVKDANVLFCANGLTAAAFRVYAQQMFIACALDEQVVPFELKPAADLNRLSIIRERGVSSIQLGSVAFEASRKLLPSDASLGRSLLKSVSDQVSALIARDDTVSEQRALEDLIVNVQLKLQGNSQADIEAQRSIDEIAVKMVQEDQDEGFTIITRDGNRLTDLSVKLHKKIKVSSRGEFIDYGEVWIEMADYYQTLREGRLLDV